MKTQKRSLTVTKSQNYPGKRAVQFTDHIVDGLFVVLMLFLLLVAIYIKLDSDSVYQSADPKRWIQYKPDFPEDVESFEDLQKLNPAVKAWLTIYGTNIDYPVLYSPEDNNYYLNHNAKNEWESSGSIFLDYRNTPDFTDFNNVLHGHHMAEHKMFGDLDLFAKEEFFQTHEFGNFYFNENNYGVQIIATILTDGYDAKIYDTSIQTDEEKLQFLSYIYGKAVLIRGVDLTNKDKASQERSRLQAQVTSPITPNDRLLVFSTCNLNETNGRYIVVAKLLDHAVENPFPETELKIRNNSEHIDTFTLFNRYGALPLWIWLAILILLIIVTYILYKLSRRRDRRIIQRRNSQKETDAHDEHED